MSRIGKSIKPQSRLVVARGWVDGRGSDGEWLLMVMRFPLGWWKCSKIILWLMVAQSCEYAKTHWTVHFKKVNFMVWELYFNKLLWFLFVIISWEDFHWVWKVCLVCSLHKIHFGVISRRLLEKTKQIPKRHVWWPIQRNINTSIKNFI